MGKHADSFEDIKASNRKLLAKLAACPIENVLGVVLRNYGVGGRSVGEKRQTYTFGLAAWRIVGGPMKRQELTMFRNNLTENRVLKIHAKLALYTVFRFRARVLPTAYFGTRQAFLEEIVGPDDSDYTLNAIAADLRKPVTYDDRVLGKLTLDRFLGRFEGTTRWRGYRVSVYLAAVFGDNYSSSLATIRFPVSFLSSRG